MYVLESKSTDSSGETRGARTAKRKFNDLGDAIRTKASGEKSWTGAEASSQVMFLC